MLLWISENLNGLCWEIAEIYGKREASLLPWCCQLAQCSAEALRDVVDALLLLQLHVSIHLQAWQVVEGHGITIGEHGGVTEASFRWSPPQLLCRTDFHAAGWPMIVLVALRFMSLEPSLECISVLAPVLRAGIGTWLTIQRHHRKGGAPIRWRLRLHS